MHFRQQDCGDFRIYAGALDAPRGTGYIAAVVVERIRGDVGDSPELYRDDELAGGYRWDSPAQALSYATQRAMLHVSPRPLGKRTRDR